MGVIESTRVNITYSVLPFQPLPHCRLAHVQLPWLGLGVDYAECIGSISVILVA